MPEVAIAGAGLGGLTAALALARARCRVTVFERTAVLAEAGAGVQLSPNATAVLAHLGLLDDLVPVALEPAEVLIRRGRDGATLARLPLGAAARRRYGHPSLVLMRADLQRVLLKRAAAEPAVAIVLDRAVSGFEPDGYGTTVRFADPRHDPLRFDGLVAADGLRSVLRPLVGDAVANDTRPSGRTAWRSLVPSGNAGADALAPRSNLWLGSGAHLVHYPVDQGRRINVVAIVDEPAPIDAEAFWTAPGDPAVLRRRFADWALPARRLIEAAPDWRRWPLFDRPPLARWSRGPVTLLGDAAHPMLPFLAQGAAQSIEDALVLGENVAASPDDLPAAFVRYERARRARTARVQAESARQGRIYHLPPPTSLARDLVLRAFGPARLAARHDWLYGGGPRS